MLSFFQTDANDQFEDVLYLFSLSNTVGHIRSKCEAYRPSRKWEQGMIEKLVAG